MRLARKLANAYDLMVNPGMLTLIAGGWTEQWDKTYTAPLVVYPFEGNFEAQVKVMFAPVRNYQAAGLGVRPAQTQDTFLRIARHFHDGQGLGVSGIQQGKGFGYGVSYTDDTAYLKIERQGMLFTFSYSTNENNWVVLQKNYVFEMPTEVEIFLVCKSATNNEGIIAQFSNFIVVKR